MQLFNFETAGSIICGKGYIAYLLYMYNYTTQITQNNDPYISCLYPKLHIIS